MRDLTDHNATLTLTDDPIRPRPTGTYEVRVKARANGFADSEYSDPPETIDVTAVIDCGHQRAGRERSDQSLTPGAAGKILARRDAR